MTGKNFILAVDQGTSSSKALVVDRDARVIAVSDKIAVKPRFPRPNMVELEPDEILQSVILAVRDVLAKGKIPVDEIACFSFANQGETIIAFDRKNLAPIYPAISWQDRRQIEGMNAWKTSDFAASIESKTGLRPDPYFSAPKMLWILKNVPQARVLLDDNRLCLSTSDVWLLAKMMKDVRFVTDLATASRTMLFNLEKTNWDSELLEQMEIPRQSMPGIELNDSVIGVLDENLFGFEVPISGVCVDQQAALFGQMCFEQGDIKSTYGTGCFILGNIGSNANFRSNGLLTSVAWQVGAQTKYTLDGGIYAVGAIYNWLIHQLGIVNSIEKIEEYLCAGKDSQGVYFIPALSGLAAPYWVSELKGSWHGMGLSTSAADLVRAAVQSITFRVKDILDCMKETGLEVNTIRCDGGVTNSAALMQIQSDLLNVPVQVMKQPEATAYGVALFGGLSQGFWTMNDLKQLAKKQTYKTYLPRSDRFIVLEREYEMWKSLVERQFNHETR